MRKKFCEFPPWTLTYNLFESTAGGCFFYIHNQTYPCLCTLWQLFCRPNKIQIFWRGSFLWHRPKMTLLNLRWLILPLILLPNEGIYRTCFQNPWLPPLKTVTSFMNISEKSFLFNWPFMTKVNRFVHKRWCRLIVCFRYPRVIYKWRHIFYHLKWLSLFKKT